MKILFEGLNKKFLVKYYAISIILFIIAFKGAFTDEGFKGGMLLLALINTILFPFAIIFWDIILNKVITLIFGESNFILPIYGILIYKILRIFVLYVCAFLVGPFGIIYILFKTK